MCEPSSATSSTTTRGWRSRTVAIASSASCANATTSISGRLWNRVRRPEDHHLVVVDQDDWYGERGHQRGLRTEMLVQPDLTAQAFRSARWRCSGERRVAPRTGRVATAESARRSDDMAHVDELADGPFRPLDRRPGGPAVTRPPARIWSDCEHRPSRGSAASTPRARRPAGAGDERQRRLAGRAGRRPPRAPRGLELGAQRRDDRLGLARALGVERASSPRARRSAAAAPRGRCARARSGSRFEVRRARTGRRSPRRPRPAAS